MKPYPIRLLFTLLAGLCLLHSPGRSSSPRIDLRTIERQRVISHADQYLNEQPLTITARSSPRSAGGIHEYFSEGDYWWPDPKNPDGPYIQRDGMTNPDNFVFHRQALIRFSVQVAALAAAYELTGDERYAEHAAQHLRAWFIDPATCMRPHLKYAQAIKGKVSGRGTGVIDTIHLIEIARAIPVLEKSHSITPEEAALIRKWFEEYRKWLTTDRYGIDEREAKNNHGSCWVMQVAAFSQLAGDSAQLAYCRDRFKEILLPNQMAKDGSFPLELKRTKPYGYSLFNLEVLSAICRILSTPDDNLWKFTLPDGRNMKMAMEFMYPYIADKSKWPYPRDSMYFESWPVRQSSLLFAGLALNEQRYIELWGRLDPDPTTPEIIRNYPIRQPVLWMKDDLTLPDLYLIDAQTLSDVRAAFQAKQLTKSPALKRLLREADKALEFSPVSVMQKEAVPPSGSKHDYMSVAPYWWPDSTKPAGAPYVRRDGERNPDRENVGDRKQFGEMMEAVQTLGLAFYITADEKYAEHASLLLHVWFLDSATCMNPNLNYAQSIRGRTEGRGAGIIDAYGCTSLLESVRLLEDSPSWKETDQSGLKKWFSNYLDWLLESDNGKKEATAKNNHGTTYDVQVASIALFVGRRDLAVEVVKAAPSRHIAVQVEPDGEQPLELIRTKSWGYSLLNLGGLINLALIGDRLGIDLWSFQTDDGRSIRKALEYLVPFAEGKQKWPHTQIVPFDPEQIYPLLQLASVKYHNSAYRRAIEKGETDKWNKNRFNLLYPTMK